MTRAQRILTGWGAALALLLAWNDGAHAAPNGTVQQRLLTFSDAATNTLTFTVSTALGAGDAASVLLDFTADGSAALPSSEPFSTAPDAGASVTFAFTYAGSALGALNFNAAQAAAPGGFSASSGVATPNVNLSVTKPASTFGRYVITLTFPAGASGLSSNWTLAIANVPTAPPTRGTAYIDGGKFSALATTGACGGGTAPSTCPPGQSCQPNKPWPPENICIIHPKLCELRIWYPHWWPWPAPCLSCPFPPWKETWGEEFERVLVSFTPFAKGGQPLGAAHAKEIQMHIDGGRAVGEVVDLGAGEYAQLIEFRKGNASPVVSETSGGQTSSPIIAGVAVGGSNLVSKVLSVLLVLTVAVAAYLLRRNRGKANAR